MDYKVLYRKYRPTNFDEVIGQNYTVQILKNAFLDGKISHANLFTGPRGTGKTSTAKLLSKLMNCENPHDGKPCGCCNSCLNIHDNPDIIEIDAASNTGVDNIRELINNVKIAPSFAKYKVYIIDEVHMLTTSAFNALLLTLEEPPKNIIFILATTEIQSVPITILSRCQRFDFCRIDSCVIFNQLKKVSELENINITDEALKEISEICDGGMRDAYSILDQVSKKSDKIEVEDIYSMFGSISNNAISSLIEDVVDNNVDKVLNRLEEFKKSSTNYLNIVDKLIKILNIKAKDCLISKNDNNFDLYKNMALELSKLYSDRAINNPYLIIEMIILGYCRVEKYFPGNNFNCYKQINDSNLTRKKDIVNEICKEQINNETNVIITATNNDIDQNGNDDYLNKLVRVRINNTFVEVNKVELNNQKRLFKEFINQVNNNLLNLLEDSDVVAASSKYMIIATDSDPSAQLINNEIDLIEEEYSKLINYCTHIIAISKECWNKVTEEYKNNIKNKRKYEYLDEPTHQENNNDVFDSSIIEIE